MALLENDGQSSSLQQVMMRFYEELINQKAWTVDKYWKEEENESQVSRNQGSSPEDKERNGQKQQEGESNGKSHSPTLLKVKQPSEGELRQPPHQQQQPEADFIRVYQNNELIYEKEIKKGANTPSNPDDIQADRLAGQLEVLQFLPPGTIVASAPNLKIEVERKQQGHSIAKQVVFATDTQGKISENILAHSQEKSLSGAEVVKQQLAQLKTNPETQAVADALTRMTALIETQANAQNQIMNKLFEQNQELSKLLNERTQQPKNPNWWQQFKHRWGQYSEQRQERQVAKTLKDIFQREANSDSQLYQGASYSIVREEGNNQSERYSLRNKQGNELMQFEVAKSGVIEILANQLQSQQLKEIAQARNNLRENLSLSGAFASLETQINLRQQRTNRIVNQLIKGANQENVQRQGEHYNLSISPQGNVEIVANDGRGAIYSQTRTSEGMSINNQMSEKDLKFFEQSLSQQTQQQTVQQKALAGMRRGR